MEDTLEGVKKRNSGLYTREQLFFEAQADKLDSESQRAIRNKEMQYTDADYYIRKAITAGNSDLLTPSNIRKVGISNLDKNVLPDLVNCVVSGIRLAYATDATETDASKVSYSNSGAIPFSVANGELLISIDDKPIVEIPAARFFNNSSTATPHSVQGYEDIVSLKALRMIRANQPIIITFKCVEGVSLPTGKHFIEARLLGVSNRKR